MRKAIIITMLATMAACGGSPDPSPPTTSPFEGAIDRAVWDNFDEVCETVEEHGVAPVVAALREGFITTDAADQWDDEIATLVVTEYCT